MTDRDMTPEDWQRLYSQRYGLELTGTQTSDSRLAPVQTIVNRRTHRRYRDQPIDDAIFELLKCAAQSAPSKSDLQQYSVIEVNNAEIREAIAALMPKMPWVGTAPRLLVFCGDLRRNRRLTAFRGYEYASDNADSFLNAAVDASIAMTSMINAAESIGLGCCPISVIRDHLETVTTLLDIPTGVFPVAGLTIGWPADNGHASMRLPPALVFHRDRYDDSQLEDEIEAHDARRHERFAIAPDRQRNADRYGVQETCRWSDNVARQLSVAERVQFRAWLAAMDISLD